MGAPEKEPIELATEIVDTHYQSMSHIYTGMDEDAREHAIITVKHLLKMGLFFPLNQYQIKYLNDVIENIKTL